MKELYHPSKKEFQLERVILFSDAVFAIAITLLIIDIKVPDLSGKTITDASFWEAFEPVIPKIISFLFSFAMIAMYWSKHHQLFGFVTRYSPRLLFLNFAFLLGIVIMPYTTAVYSEYSDGMYAVLLLPFLFYTLNIVLCSVSLYFLWRYISNPKNRISDFEFEKPFLRSVMIRNMILPSVFTLSLLASWMFHSPYGRFVLFTLPLFFRLTRIRPEKTLQKNQQ